MNKVILLIAFTIVAVSAQTPFTAANCPAYCGLVNSTVCGGTFPAMGYTDYNGCLAVCNAMAAAVGTTPQPFNFAGFINQTANNTMGCRLYHLNVAVSQNLSVHCLHASIHGGGVCVSPAPATVRTDACGTYCVLQGAFCPENFALAGGAFDPIYCGTVCAGYVNFTNILTNPVSQDTNSMDCRLYHSGAAYSRSVNPSAYVHCAHSSPMGGNVCKSSSTTSREVFCTILAGNCLPSNFPYSSVSQCISDALTYNDTYIGVQIGAINATGIDDLGCRAYHGGLPSKTLPGTHCQHAGWSTANQCGSRPSTAAPTTPAPTPAATGATPTDSASSIMFSVALCIVAMIVALF